MKQIAFSLGLLVYAISLIPAALADPLRWQPASYPFLPGLVEQHDPELCQAFLDLATDAHKDDDFEIDLQDRSWPGLPSEWIFSTKSTESRAARIYDPNL